MALVLADRVKDTTTTTGTGTVTLSGTAPTGYQNFAVIGNGNTTYYTIAGGSEWEVGIGTYATSGPTLARTTVLASTNGGSAVSFSAGTKDVFVTYPAEVATALGNPTATNGGVVYGTGTAVNVSAAGTVNGYQFLQSAGAASPTWAQINSFKDVATAPTSPTPIEGDRFFDNTTGIDYTYITDVDGSQWVETAPGNLASVAGGSSTQVQYNNAGILGGITGATTNGTVLTLTTPVLGAATGTSLALGGATLGSNALAVTGTTQLNSALNYGGVTLSNSVTGTGSMVLSASPTLTGTALFSAFTASGQATFTGAGISPRILESGASGADIYLNSKYGGVAGAFRIQAVVGTIGLIALGTETLTTNGSNVTIGVALNYGGVTLSNSVTGTGSMVLSASPTLTGTLTGAAATFSGTLGVTGAATFNARISQTLTPAAAEYALRSTGQTTGWISVSLNNTGGEYVVAGENSSGNNLIIGDSAYDMVIRAPSGISFSANAGATQHMRLSSSGLLGIGMTPSNVLDITQNQNNESRISILNSNGGASAAAELQATNGTHAGVLYQFGTGYTTSGILRQDGTVLSSGSSAGGLTLATFSSSPIYFAVGLAEVARFDTGGGLFLGVTTSWSQSRIDSKATGVTNSFNAVSGWNSGSAGAAYTARVDNTAAYLIEFYYGASTSVGKITTNGTATTYNTSSDARLKTNVSDAAPASALIDAIQVRQFDWKVDNSHQRYGMVAQELLEVAPEAVSVPTDPEQMMGVDYSTLVPMLIKEVQSLRTRLSALEAK